MGLCGCECPLPLLLLPTLFSSPSLPFICLFVWLLILNSHIRNEFIGRDETSSSPSKTFFSPFFFFFSMLCWFKFMLFYFLQDSSSGDDSNSNSGGGDGDDTDDDAERRALAVAPPTRQSVPVAATVTQAGKRKRPLGQLEAVVAPRRGRT